MNQHKKSSNNLSDKNNISTQTIDVLKEFWGYENFRFPQNKIIENVLLGNDGLALLPTGGGKSICFQVPALIMEGTCLVISPLIALMKDQVLNLKKRGINAKAIVSGMHQNEIETIVENCKAGKVKLLYLSPERLLSDIMRERLSHVKLSFIAVDEAHCISQWGYDFRPPYMKIAEFRNLHPSTPIMALTATATPKVADDIEAKLEFNQSKVFKKSYLRENLAYKVYFGDNKWNQLTSKIKSSEGSGIIYTRSRKLTKEIATYLLKQNIPADFYHAGLSPLERDAKQKAWVENKTRIICATNAFGMGIDKPDVRRVFHLHLPENLESYFQEAGRGGRDLKPAEAITFFDQQDIELLESRAAQVFPPKKLIKSVYTALGNYFQLPIGSGKDAALHFDIDEFIKRFNFNKVECFNALKALEKDEYILLTEPFNLKSRVFIKISYTALYNLQLKNPKLELFLKTLLRNYSGLFDGFVNIKEEKLARILGVEESKVKQILKYLNDTKVLDYLPSTNKPQIIFTKERLATENVFLTKENYEDRKQRHLERTNAMVNFLKNDRICRSIQLLKYFGEESNQKCGVCDVCLKQNGKQLSNKIENAIKDLLIVNPMQIQDLASSLSQYPEEELLQFLTKNIEAGKIFYDNSQKLTWKG